jgi:uncharacterized Zn finger protein
MSKLTKAVWEGRSSDDPYVRLWIRTLESDADPGRLARGRVYYAAGNVAQIQVDPGTVRGRVSGSRNAPYQVSIRVNECSEYEWKAAWEVAQETAWRAVERAVVSGRQALEVLATDHILRHVDQIWRSLDIPTFAERLEFGIRATCSCPDYEELCKHVVALWYEFGERLRNDPALFITLFGGPAENWTRALGQMKRLTQPSQPASDSGAGPRMVLLPADAERNLEDRSIFELVSRYWRPIREIRQPGDDGGETREGDIPVELESPIADLRAILCEDPAVFRRSLERMYAEIRGRAAAIRLDIDSPPEQDSHGARYRS